MPSTSKPHPIIRRFVREAKKRGAVVFHNETFAGAQFPDKWVDVEVDNSKPKRKCRNDGKA